MHASEGRPEEKLLHHRVRTKRQYDICASHPSVWMYIAWCQNACLVCVPKIKVQGFDSLIV